MKDPVKTYTVEHKLLHTELHGQNGEAHKRETVYNYRWQEEMDLSFYFYCGNKNTHFTSISGSVPVPSAL